MAMDWWERSEVNLQDSLLAKWMLSQWTFCEAHLTWFVISAMSARAGTVNMRQYSNENEPPNRDSFGSNVSRLKSVFQQGDPAGQPVYRLRTTKHESCSENRSPDSKRRKEIENKMGRNASTDKQDVASVNPSDIDPQKYFESTNHVQRFQHTRAIFAQMEQKNISDRTRPTSRFEGSRRLRGASPSPHPRSSQAQANRLSAVEMETDAKPNGAAKPAISAAKPKVLIPPQSKASGTRGWSRPSRGGSVDSLDDPSPLSPTRANSRSEPDLSSSRPQTTAPHFEPTEKSVLPPSATNATYTKQDSSQSKPSASSSSSSYSSLYSRPGASSGGEPAPNSYVRGSSNHQAEVEERVARRNRYNLEHSSDSFGGSSSGGPLLPKRRSRDENRLSTEEIEQSLQDADKYWHSQGEDPAAGRMSESTYSSGSGEEMAHSDSNHELSHGSPTSPDFPLGGQQQPWMTQHGLPATPFYTSQDSTPTNEDYGSSALDEPVPDQSYLRQENDLLQMDEDEVQYVNIRKMADAEEESVDALQAPDLRLKKMTSPSETSVSSMTPSEQDNLLSRQSVLWFLSPLTFSMLTCVPFLNSVTMILMHMRMSEKLRRRSAKKVMAMKR